MGTIISSQVTVSQSHHSAYIHQFLSGYQLAALGLVLFAVASAVLALVMLKPQAVEGEQLEPAVVASTGIAGNTFTE
jgi:hypothetical protein